MPSPRPAPAPNYFIAAFGSPHVATDPVHGGVYPLLKTVVTASGVKPGDVMILYCCGGYPGHDREAPAIGVVTKLEVNSVDGRLTDIHYQYLPLYHSIPLDTLKATIPALITIFSRAVYQLQRVPKNSFRAALADRQIDWP